MVRCMLMAALMLGLVGSLARGAEKLEEQYQSLASARTKSEIAIRKLRTWFEENETKWQKINQSRDSFFNAAIQAVDKSREMESRKDENMRNDGFVQDLEQKRNQFEQDWNRQGPDREEAERGFRRLNEQCNQIWEAWQNLSNLERTFKDAKVELTSLQSAYDALTQRVGTLTTEAEKAITDSENTKKAWENTAGSVKGVKEGEGL